METWESRCFVSSVLAGVTALLFSACGGDGGAVGIGDGDAAPGPADVLQDGTAAHDGDDVARSDEAAATDTVDDQTAADMSADSIGDVSVDAREQCLQGTPSSSTTECRGCVCDHCAEAAIACEADAGCQAIRDCALRTGCSLAGCYQPDTCQDVIDQAGGLSGPSVALAIPFGACLIDNSCCGYVDEPETCTVPPLGDGSADAPPELQGPYAVALWESPPGAPVTLTQGIYYPVDAPCPGAPVVLVHGGGAFGCFHVRMAQLLASRGLIAVVPTMPSRNRFPAPEDGDLINALLDWTVAQGDDAGSPLYGIVDGSLLGVAGHSNGGIVFYAASSNPDIAAIVGWDAVAGLEATGGLHGASLHLVADGESRCGGASREGYDNAPEPKALATVASSTHCDFQDPPQDGCVTACGTDPYDPVVAGHVERYSVAWLVCLLGHDPTMADYVSLDGLEGLKGVEQVGTISCRPATCE